MRRSCRDRLCDVGRPRLGASPARRPHFEPGGHCLNEPKPVALEQPVPWLRVAVASLPPLLVSMWLSIPALQPTPQDVRGTAAAAEACLLVCARVVQVGDLKLACTVDLLGVPYDCRGRLAGPGEVTARYATLPSLAGLIGHAPTQGTLLRLEREGRVVYARSVAQHVWSALYGGWVFHAVYWPVVGLIAWRWPASRIGRRFSSQTAPP